MCGIVGYIGTDIQKNVSVFKDMLRVDVVRGKDSTGVLFANNSAHQVVKYPCLPEVLMETKAFGKAISKFWNVYIGHNRFATTGDITVDNAHPFKHDHIIGVHNGTIRDRSLLPEHKEFDVDSDNVIYAIANWGIGRTWSSINGAASLVWWDKKAKTLNMLRNSERPMCFARTVANEGLFFASEPWMIMAMAARNGVEIERVYQTEVDKLYILKYDANAKEGLKVTIDHEKVFPFTPHGGKAWGYTGNIGIDPADRWDKEFERIELNHQRRLKEIEERAKATAGQADAEIINHGSVKQVLVWSTKLGEIVNRDDRDRLEKAFDEKKKEEAINKQSPLQKQLDGTTHSQTSTVKEKSQSSKVVSIVHKPATLVREKATSVFPFIVHEQYDKDNKNKLIKYKIECRFQNDKSKKAFIFVSPDDPHGILDYCPGHSKHFSRVYFKAPVIPIIHGHLQVCEYWIRPEDVEFIIPSDAKRNCGSGRVYTKTQFDAVFKNCAWCDGSLDFQDINIIFADTKNAAICGDCAIQTSSGDKGQNFSIYDIRNLLENTNG
jgi:hypothetical protein